MLYNNKPICVHIIQGQRSAGIWLGHAAYVNNPILDIIPMQAMSLHLLGLERSHFGNIVRYDLSQVSAF